MSLKNLISRVARRTKNGFTVGEIFDRVSTSLRSKNQSVPKYSTVRARVAEMSQTGELDVVGIRNDSVTSRTAFVYRCPNSNVFKAPAE